MISIMSWKKRSKELGTLLNPAFCCVVLSSSIIGYSSLDDRGMPFPLAYLVLPIVLHKPTRDKLPINTRTSLAAWLEVHPFARIQFYERVVSLKPYVGEAIIFGTKYNWLSISESHIQSPFRNNRVDGFIQTTQGETRECIMKARLVGKWLAAAGTAETVMGLLEIRP